MVSVDEMKVEHGIYFRGYTNLFQISHRCAIIDAEIQGCIGRIWCS